MMIKPSIGKCVDCPPSSGDQYLAKKYPKLCNYHNTLRKKGTAKPSGAPKNKSKQSNKATGEMIVFRMVWSEREHVCQCCSKPLGDLLKPIFFSHVLPKSIYGRFRLRKDNIWLCCPECHHEWDFGDRNLSRFIEKGKQAEKLKQLYNETNG